MSLCLMQQASCSHAGQQGLPCLLRPELATFILPSLLFTTTRESLPPLPRPLPLLFPEPPALSDVRKSELLAPLRGIVLGGELGV